MNILRTFRSFPAAFKGLAVALRTENNLKVLTLAAVAVTVLGFIFHISSNEWMMIIFAIALVYVTEILNTALENLVNLVSPGYHETAGKVKDIAAGAALVSTLAAIVIGLLIFIPYL